MSIKNVHGSNKNVHYTSKIIILQKQQSNTINAVIILYLYNTKYYECQFINYFNKGQNGHFKNVLFKNFS